MQNREWRYMDKSEWPQQGEWSDEPDKMQWADPATGMPCLIVRNNGGALCGYVGVAEGHPAFEMDYGSIEPYPEVHGGLTFASFCSPHPDDRERGICHVVEDGENDRVWWLGFDCSHCWDVSPKYDRDFIDPTSSYKNVRYVQQECASLAGQLVSMSAS